MTREEAIQTLNAMFCQYSHIRKSDSEWDAIIMAIEALQERPKGRWIELPCEVGDTVWSFYDIYDDEEKHFMVDEMIEEIPQKLERDSYIYRVGLDYGLIEPKPHKIQFYFEKAGGQE